MRKEISDCGTDGFRLREKFCTSEGVSPNAEAFLRNGNPSVPYERKLLSPRKPFNGCTILARIRVRNKTAADLYVYPHYT